MRLEVKLRECESFLTDLLRILLGFFSAQSNRLLLLSKDWNRLRVPASDSVVA